MEEKTTKKHMRETNLSELKKIVDNLKENTYYYFVYFDNIRPRCVIRKFKNAIWKEGVPYYSIYDTYNSTTITFLSNSPYEFVKEKDYIYVKFLYGYAGVFYITKSLQTAHNVLRKECNIDIKPNIIHVSNTKFYKDCMERLKKFVQNPMIMETYA